LAIRVARKLKAIDVIDVLSQVRLPEHDQVVETFHPDRTDQPLDVWCRSRKFNPAGFAP
jgi:hypothetical protein